MTLVSFYRACAIDKDLTLQRQLVDRLNGVLEPILAEVLNLRLKNTALRRTRDLLLPKLIAGEVDVSELDIAVPEEVT